MKHKVLSLLAAGVTAVLASGLSGCAGTPASSGNDAKKVLVGYSTYTVSNPFFAGMQKGLDTGAKSHGYELVTANANGDPNQQVTDIQNLISKGVNYILLTPADGKAIAPAIAAANQAGIPVISIADAVEPPIAATIQVDDVKAGQEAAKAIVANLEKTNGGPTGNVVNIQGLSGTPAAEGRNKGFVEEMAKYPGVKVVATQDGGFDTEKSNSVMSDILQANPKVDAVFCGNDAEAVGVSAAIDKAGRFYPVGSPKHIYVIGVDGSKPAIENIRKGVQDATISQNPIKMAEKAIDTVASLNDKKDVDKKISWPAQLITKDNIQSDEVRNYGIWADEV